MKKHVFILLFLMISALQVAAESFETLVLNEQTINRSHANYLYIYEDNEHEHTIETIQDVPDSLFVRLEQEIANLDFTNSSFWVRFRLKNNFRKQTHFYLETARPITNKVIFYEVKNGKIISEQRSGDDFSFSDKTVAHRKNIFKLNLWNDESREFYIKLVSDGEMINLPFVVMDPDYLLSRDYVEQYTYGIYYGVMLIVFLIFFFFAIILKDNTFYFYSVYVLSLALLQFSLDGLSFQYLFPDNAYMANRSVLLSATLTVFFVLFYAKRFLKVRERFPLINKIYNGFIAIAVVCFFFSLTYGVLYEITFPLINGASLISTLFIIFTIFYAKYKGYKVCNYFALAFIFLITGAVIFILGNFNVIQVPILTQSVLKYASTLEIIFLSISMANRYRDLQREKEEAQQSAVIQLEEKKKLAEDMNVKLEKQVEERTKEIKQKSKQLERKNKDITDSLTYAQRIQNSILPPDRTIKKAFDDYFNFYLPKDQVSGDFYWFSSVKTTPEGGESQQLSLVAAVDCTGHGVPGALISVLGNSALNASVKAKEVNSPAEALDFLHQRVVDHLHQDSDQEVKDGMDLSLCAVDRKNMKLMFAGANNPVYIVRDKELFELKGNKRAVGGFNLKNEPFINKSFDLKSGDMIYLFSDGYADQFGGDTEAKRAKGGKKFKYCQFKELLKEISNSPMNEQHDRLQNRFFEWKGELEQIDDVCVIGVRV